MEKSKNVTVTFRISPEAYKLLKQHAPGRHGFGYVISDCVVKQLGKGESK